MVNLCKVNLYLETGDFEITYNNKVATEACKKKTVCFTFICSHKEESTNSMKHSKAAPHTFIGNNNFNTFAPLQFSLSLR